MINSDQSFLEQIKTNIAANLTDEQFGVVHLANMMGMSRSHLYRRLQKIKGKSISRYIREYRLEVARLLLLEKEMTTSEVSYNVGFGSPSYFSKCFREYFGYSPSKTRLFIFSNTQRESINRLDKTEKRSVMVLPLKNLSSNKKNQYLVEGVVYELNRLLSEIADLRVISSSAISNWNSIIEIREKLGVETVIQGSLQQQNDTLRIEIALFDTFDGSQIWAQKYDRKILNLLQIQSDIAKAIVYELKINMSAKERSIIIKRTSYNPLAYDSYLKGVYHMNLFGEKEVEQSLSYFEKAISIDSSIAPAYAAIANFYHMKASIFSASIDSKEAFTHAKRYLDIALKLDKDWHLNFTMKAFQLTFFHWNFEEANLYYEIGLKAKKPLNYIMYRDFLQFENRHQEALEISLRVNRYTPFYPNAPLILSYYYCGMYSEGEAFLNERLASFPTHHLIYDNGGFFMLNTGNYEKAIRLFEQLILLKERRFPRALGWMGAAYARLGEFEKSRKILAELKELKKKTDAGSPAWFTAIILSALDQKKEALKWIQIAVDDHEMEVVWLVCEPQFFSLHGDPKFGSLVKQVGFREHSYPIKS